MDNTIGRLLPALVLAVLTTPGLRAQVPPDEVDLAEATRLFQRYSPRMEIARARLDAALGAARQGTAVPNPSLSATHENLGSYDESYVLLAQPLPFLWEGGSRGARADALARESRARFSADSALLVADLKTTFVEAWSSRRRAEALATAGTVLDDLVADATARVEEGDLAGYDLRRLRWERVRLARRHALEEIALENAERALGALVSELEGGARVAAVGLAPGGPPELERSDLVSWALQRRSRLAAAEASVQALEEDVDLVARSWLAGTTATGGLKTQSGGTEGWFLGLEVPLPFTDRRQAARQSAEAAVTEARAREQALRRAVALEVNQAATRLASLRRQADLMDLGEDGGEEVLLDIARLSYAEGEIGIVELLDAADAWLEARLTRTGIQSDAWAAYFELEAAVGGFAPAAGPGGNDR